MLEHNGDEKFFGQGIMDGEVNQIPEDKAAQTIDPVDEDNIECLFHLISRHDEPHKDHQVNLVGQIILDSCPGADEKISLLAEEKLREGEFTEEDYSKIMNVTEMLMSGGLK